nr:RNA-directed DNA polymerase, eukaryota [Tanacetum cinerariifolium]
MGNINSNLLNKHMNVINFLQEFYKLKCLEVAQKAKIKWSIEGHENSKYFHGILNKKRNNLAISGILVDGVWIDSPSMVKDEFMSHFKNRFDCPFFARISLDMNFPKQLSLDSKEYLEKNVTKDELKKAVWDCGLDKSPGLEGFTSNILIIINVLKCFIYASGHRINMHKSELMRIVVDDNIVIQVARSIGCLKLKPPFSYLVHIQALVDGKRVNIKESSIRRTLRLDDAEGTSCLTNAEIFKGLARMGAKTTSWNEFSSTMASAIICLATNQKFNFSRYILLSLVKNIKSGVPIFMFLRFVQLIINHQLGDMTHHKDIFATPSLTKKIFSNMKRVGTGFSREVTLLFANMLVQTPKEVGNLQADAQPISIPTKPSTSKPQKKHKPKRKHTQEPEVPPIESQPKPNVPLPLLSHDPLPNGEDSLKLKELMDFCTNLSNKVLDLESEMIDIKSTYQARVEKLEAGVQDTLITAAEANKVSVPRKRREPKPLKRKAQIELDEEVARQLKAELNANVDWNVVIEKVQKREKLTDAVMKYQALKRKPLTEVQAKWNMIVYLKNMAGYKMNYFKRMTYDEIIPLFEKHYNYNQAFLNKVNEGVKVPEKEVSQEVKVESSKREGGSLEKEIAKKQKIKQETEELKKHLQIVPDDDDDNVYTDVTPLASKIPIVDYKIHTKRNRPYFKIIKADGNHMLFLSFNIMLKNFNREDLESLWNIVRERFTKTEPKNYSDDFLLNTLKIMFEKPNVEANVWKDQKGKYGLAKVKRWKLFESCGVHCLTLLTTQIFLLVERMYPLRHFTLKQMINDVMT